LARRKARRLWKSFGGTRANSSMIASFPTDLTSCVLHSSSHYSTGRRFGETHRIAGIQLWSYQNHHYH
jgi:hypothetical protein